MTANLPESNKSVSSRRARLLAVALTLGGLAWSLGLIRESDGLYMDDDITHYLYARGGWDNPVDLLHRWARPGYNLPTAVVAHYFGMDGCRVFSALQTAVVAWLAWAIAARLSRPGLPEGLAPAMVWLQPLVFKLSLTTLTETTAAVYLAAGVWLFLVRRRVLACAVISLCCVTRDEMLGLLPILAAGVLYEAWRQYRGDFSEVLSAGWVWACAVAAVWAPVTYWATAWVLDLPPDASPLLIFSRDYTPEYGSGPAWWYPLIWLEAASLGVPLLAVLGFLARPRAVWFPAAWVGGLVALEGLIFTFGLFASGGYARFLVPIAGPLGALAAIGLREVLVRRSWRLTAAGFLLAGAWLAGAAMAFETYLPMPRALPLAAAGVVGLSGVLVGVLRRPGVTRAMCVVLVVGAMATTVAHAGYLARPLRLRDSALNRVLLEAVAYVRQEGLADRPVLCQHTLMLYLHENSAQPSGNDEALGAWRSAEPGTLFVWENKYCLKPHEPESTQQLIDALEASGRLLTIIRSGPYTAKVYVRQ